MNKTSAIWLCIGLGLIGCGGIVEAEEPGPRWDCAVYDSSPALPEATGPVCVCSDLESEAPQAEYGYLSYAWELSVGACIPPDGGTVVEEPASAWECHVSDTWDNTPGSWCVCSLPCDGRFASCGSRGDTLVSNPECEPPNAW